MLGTKQSDRVCRHLEYRCLAKHCNSTGLLDFSTPLGSSGGFVSIGLVSCSFSMDSRLFQSWDTRLDPAFVVWFVGTFGLELLSLGMEFFHPFHAPADPSGSSLQCFDLDLVFCVQVKPSSLEISTSKQHRHKRRMSRIFGGRAAAKVSFGPTEDGKKRADGWLRD